MTMCFFPDGLTPLMLASFRGGGLELGCEDESGSASGSGEGGDSDNTSVDVITSLLMQGAAINAQTDRTGQLLLSLLNFFLFVSCHG